MVPASVPASRPLPGLPSVDCDLGYVSQINPFLHKVLLVSGYHSARNLRQCTATSHLSSDRDLFLSVKHSETTEI